MPTLGDAVEDAERRGVALGHFNVSELIGVKAVTAAARELGVPVLLGVSEGERAFIGVGQVAALVRSLRQGDGPPVFVNADHTRSLAKAEEAARAGFDMILFDGSAWPFEENVCQTKRAVDAIKSIDPSIVVEGELGHIGDSSVIVDQAPESARVLTTAEEARQFMEATAVDVLAPAVGNMHGLLRSMVSGEAKKRLDVERIREIKAASGLPMTLHGGSGTDDDDLARAIKAGMTIVHINTELRLAWRRGLEVALASHPAEIVPYKLLPRAVEAVQSVVRARLALFTRA